MEVKNKKLESFLKRAEADPTLMEVLKGIVYYCQCASEMGVPLDEIAAAGTVGYTIGKDPKLKELLKHLIMINEMGLNTDQ